MELTIPAAVAGAAREFGDAVALAEPGGPRLSFRQLRERATVVARALIGQGVLPGDRVAIWSPNTHHWVLGALGSLQAGAILVPVNTRFTGPEALDVISRSGARVLIVAGLFLGTDRLAALRQAEAAQNGSDDGDCLANLSLVIRVPIEDSHDHGGSELLGPRESSVIMKTSLTGTAGAPSVRVINWDELDERADLVAPERAEERAAAVAPDQVSDIMFTSGTTGCSKGAMSAHRQSLAVAGAWAQCGGLTSADRYLVVNPFFHTFGLKAGILACLASGATIVPQLVFHPGQAMELIEAERITVFPGAPTIYQTILDHGDRARYDLSSLRLAVTGAAVVPVALVERMRRELTFDTVLTAYGLTEAVVATMCRPGDDPQTVARTSGRAVADFEVRIAGPAADRTATGKTDAGETGETGAGETGETGAEEAGAGETHAGETGEILLRGPNLMLGYLDDPEATRAAIDADGWLHTGDVGRLDARGYLTITDRLKDMYICGGFNVYPAEVEQVLARLDGVADSAVIGVADARLGEVGKAYVVARPGCALQAADVLAFCRERLANYKMPRQVEFRASLPRNVSGKLLKRVLREES